MSRSATGLYSCTVQRFLFRSGGGGGFEVCGTKSWLDVKKLLHSRLNVERILVHFSVRTCCYTLFRLISNITQKANSTLKVSVFKHFRNIPLCKFRVQYDLSPPLSDKKRPTPTYAVKPLLKR
jgi:hypothetical protein